MKNLTGIVISAKFDQGAVVMVETSWRHPLYSKLVRRTKKYLVQNDVKAIAGQWVEIQETRPLSARKRYTITGVIKK